VLRARRGAYNWMVLLTYLPVSFKCTVPNPSTPFSKQQEIWLLVSSLVLSDGYLDRLKYILDLSSRVAENCDGRPGKHISPIPPIH
jgi:hypothetical protein